MKYIKSLAGMLILVSLVTISAAEVGDAVNGGVGTESNISVNASVPIAVSPSAWDSETSKFLVLINNYRTANGLSNLSMDALLENSSDWMSNDLLTHCVTGYYPCSHTDSLGRTPDRRLQDFNYPTQTSPYACWGEIIAWGNNGGLVTAQDAFNAWRNHSTHNALMLANWFVAAGIARSCDANYNCAWVVDFGGILVSPFNDSTPPSEPPEFNYSISLSPSSGTGMFARTKVSTKLISGSAQKVTLSCSNLPAGASCIFIPGSGNLNFTSTLMIMALRAQKGTYNINVVAVAGGVTRTATYTLTR